MTSKQNTKELTHSDNKPTGLQLDSPQIQNYDVIIGGDTEYRNKEGNKSVKEQTDQANYNEVISYQYSAFSLLDVEGQEKKEFKSKEKSSKKSSK